MAEGLLKRLFLTRLGMCVGLALLLVTAMAAPAVSADASTSAWLVSCLGDSITRGSAAHGIAGSPYTYPAQLQGVFDNHPELGTFTVINHGISGGRAEHILAQMPTYMAENPDFVLLLIGLNDLWGGGKESHPPTPRCSRSSMRLRSTLTRTVLAPR